MGPKKGKKKGGKKSGDGGGGGGSKKKESGDTITFNEAVRTYQLEVKQMHLSRLRDDIFDLKGKNDRQKQRNFFLRKEQNGHIKDVIVQARQENEETSKNVQQVPYTDVEKALQQKLSAIHIEEDAVEGLKEKIEALEKEIEVYSKQLEELHEYKEHGQHVDKTHVKVMLKEMEDMDTSYTEMANFFDKSLTTMKQTITKQNYENIAVQKNLASEVVIKNLDKHTEQEFLDNDWLLKEVSIHRNHIVGAEFEIKMLEKQNIEMMSYLFEQQVDDAKQTKKFFLTCKQEDERENTLLLTAGFHGDVEEGGEEEEEVIEMEGQVADYEDEPEDLKWINEYLHEFDATAIKDDYKLGPVELKLLCIVGKQAPLHDINEMTAEGMMTASSKSQPHFKWIVEKEELKRTSYQLM